MTDQGSPAFDPRVGDYSYDLAHDVPRGEAAQSTLQEHHYRPVEVVTESSDHGQDYSYDLAHEIPPA